MLATIHQFLLHNPIVIGAWLGFSGAALADVFTFMKWKKWGDFRSFDLGVASLKWLQGAAGGALAAAGLKFV